MISLRSLHWVFPWLHPFHWPFHTQLWLLHHTCSSMHTKTFLLLQLLLTIPSLRLRKLKSILRILASLLLLCQCLLLLILAPPQQLLQLWRRRRKSQLRRLMRTGVSACLTDLYVRDIIGPFVLYLLDSQIGVFRRVFLELFYSAECYSQMCCLGF